MSGVAEFSGSRRVPQIAALALIAFGMAGCSADMTSRFQQSSIANPFGYQGEATGSVPAAAPAPQVEQRELPQYSRPHSQVQSSALPPPAVGAPQTTPVASRGVSGGGRGLASYTPPAKPKLETTGTVPPRSVAAAHPQAGTTIIVGTSDTLEVLAQRYHVTPAAILAANGYKGPRTLSPGQQLIIPGANTATAPVAAAPATRPVATAASVHVVNHGDTLAGIARRNHVSVGELVKANNLDANAPLKQGARLTVPGAKAAEAAPAAAQPIAAVQPIPTTTIGGPKLAAATPAGQQQSARYAQANPAPEPLEAAPAAKPAETTSALPTFRWPVRGKVITGYGAKTNGKANDGINVAVPEGTQVKAAEDGVVAYSGNELKGYGNLVLVRHSNGYVTAYAHASELLVKRGDTVKRGQVIAKSGQSGEVGSPQLHFEIRKGSQPVDPLQFLNGA
ncbi:MAG TPA: LysM peptidoglycan-binding domain-containing M23 family metallopeptidase [Bradyrhizobium sp.]